MVRGVAMLVLDVSTSLVDWIDTETAATLYIWLGLIGVASVFVAARSNAMTEHVLARGRQYTDNRRKC